MSTLTIYVFSDSDPPFSHREARNEISLVPDDMISDATLKIVFDIESHVGGEEHYRYGLFNFERFEMLKREKELWGVLKSLAGLMDFEFKSEHQSERRLFAFIASMNSDRIEGNGAYYDKR